MVPCRHRLYIWPQLLDSKLPTVLVLSQRLCKHCVIGLQTGSCSATVVSVRYGRRWRSRDQSLAVLWRISYCAWSAGMRWRYYPYYLNSRDSRNVGSTATMGGLVGLSLIRLQVFVYDLWGMEKLAVGFIAEKLRLFVMITCTRGL